MENLEGKVATDIFPGVVSDLMLAISLYLCASFLDDTPAQCEL
jgi:hypothetical protein